MTELNQIYKCNVCGNIAEVLHTGVGELVCCNQPMELLQEKIKDEGLEKHVPIIEKTGSSLKVKVGSVSHPMEEKHYVEWIEIIVHTEQGRGTNGKTYRQHLKPGDKPEAEFKIEAAKVEAREYCNLHGLWKS